MLMGGPNTYEAGCNEFIQILQVWLVVLEMLNQCEGKVLIRQMIFNGFPPKTIEQ